MEQFTLPEKLQSDYGVWIISNTTESHIKSLQSKFTFFDLVNGIVTSERAGTHKPNQKIFQFALSEANTDSASSIFIDDSHANVKSAESMGFTSHHYTGFDGLIEFFHPVCNFN